MVTEETNDGRRIAELFSSEIHGHERGELGRLSVVDADPDVEPTGAGAFAYGIEFEDAESHESNRRDGANGSLDAERLAAVYVHPDRVCVEFEKAPKRVVDAAETERLCVRSKASDPSRTQLFVENGAEVKGALRVVRAVAAEMLEDAG